MTRMALVIAFVLALIGPASAQKAEIEAANAKWIEFFNKGDFAGIASFFSAHAIAFPRFCDGAGTSGDRGNVEKHGRKLVIRLSQPWTSSRSAPPRHVRSGILA